MWASLSKFDVIPDETLVFCAHEDTQSNARFALTVDGGNAALIARAQAVDAARAKGEATVPSTLGEERATNPFLRADDPALAKNVGRDARDPVAVFAEIRQRKDHFK
jgi:hydroxyacylglutathione hydrolase